MKRSATYDLRSACAISAIFSLYYSFDLLNSMSFLNITAHFSKFDYVVIFLASFLNRKTFLNAALQLTGFFQAFNILILILFLFLFFVWTINHLILKNSRKQILHFCKMIFGYNIHIVYM